MGVKITSVKINSLVTRIQSEPCGMEALKPSSNHKLQDTLMSSNTPDDDDEYARYLASYIFYHLIDTDTTYVTHNELYKLIKEFNANRT